MAFIVLVIWQRKANNATELDPGSSKSEEDQTLVMLFTTLALDAVRGENANVFKGSNNVIDAQLYAWNWSYPFVK